MPEVNLSERELQWLQIVLDRHRRSITAKAPTSDDGKMNKQLHLSLCEALLMKLSECAT